VRFWNRKEDRRATQASRSMNAGAVLALSLVLVGGAIGRPSVTAAQEKPATNAVTIDNFSFGPMELTIPAGTEVTWINRDDIPHVIMSVDHKFRSRALDTDDKYSFKFQDPGTYEYFCAVHPKMTGKIVVKAQ
jgi:plastocyanin